ncbi:D-alanyl-D-alanine dipeptidase [Trinickia terrae]|uniref:D-alanyl-D-alanine dipeptidase n=1 Tax=Trinickia terrae TaxID=2571161 RepID=A0A4U1HBM3_9BURK|nr:D-alanyl-D-alanine dipeptidase [Trinickia terrae]TKC77193.1 D-alanyl-D-alanine dipeptidase [Trinickia terrae]
MTSVQASCDALVEITEAHHRVAIDLVYATSRNLTGKPICHDMPCMLLAPAEQALTLAVRSAGQLGLRLKILDAYRPIYVQEILWNFLPDPAYVADPAEGSHHNRGIAVDVTLIDPNGDELDMGTAFDTMTEESHHFYDDLPWHVQRNRAMLLGIMLASGFTHMPTEWWHYQLPNAARYPLIADA